MFAQKPGGLGLSINTDAANRLAVPNTGPPSGGLFASASKPGGLFGSTTTAPSAGTLFGASAASAATQGSGLFGTISAAPSNAGTLFGGPAASQPLSASLKPSQGSLFGNQPSQGGGLFGSQPASQAQSQAAQATSLFGTSSAQHPQQQQQQQQQQSTSLFGSTTNQQQPSQQGSSLLGSSLVQQTQPAPSLFGNTQTQQPQPQQQGTGLFGTSIFPPSQQQAGGLFSSQGQEQNQNQNQNQNQQQSANTQQQQQTLFGTSRLNAPSFGNSRPPIAQAFNSTLNPPQQTQRSLFSTSIGQYSAQQAIPGVRIDVSNLRPTTRFNDLYEGLQKEIEQVDNFIQDQIKLASECEAAMPRVANALSTVPTDVEYCQRKLEGTQQALESDAGAIDAAKSLVRADVAAARLSFKAIHNLRMPVQFHHAGSSWNAASVRNLLDDDSAGSGSGGEGSDLVKYFSKRADEIDSRLSAFTKGLGEIEDYLSGLEGHTAAKVQSVRFARGSDGAGRSADDQVRELAAVLREFEGGILAVAGKVGAAREKVQEVILGESGVRW